MQTEDEDCTFWAPESIKIKPTADAEACLVGVGGSEVIGDDTLVAALVLELDVAQMEDGRVFHDSCSVSGAGVGKVLHVGVGQGLLVFPPREGHGWAAAAHRLARQAYIFS